eukprot:UN13587
MAATEKEFYVRAITDYYGVAADELDLKENSIYTVIQTTESGWWYAIDEDGIDGWVPSNYLDRVSDEEQIQLAEQHRKQAEIEAQKQAELAAAGAYDVAPDDELDAFDDAHDDEKGGGGVGGGALQLELMKRANNFRNRQEAKQKANQGDSNAKQQFEKLEQERIARKKQNAANNQYKGRKKNATNIGKNQSQSNTKKVTNTQWKSDEE